VKRVTGTDTGYAAWSCNNCKARKKALEEGRYHEAGFETGMSITPLSTEAGKAWLHSDTGPQSGQEWLRRQTILDLHGVNFSDINTFLPQPISSYTNLTSINVSGNLFLETLPFKQLCALPKLVELSCVDCPLLISPPPEVSVQGGSAVIAFVREVVATGEANNAMVLFLIGDGESGKTSLHRALRSTSNTAEVIDREARTVGIDISLWDEQDENDILFTVYDMAGQSVYRDTHTFFVGRRAIYVFVWRISVELSSSNLNDELNDMIESWIDTLQFRLPGASIMIVATHASGVPFEEVTIQVERMQKLFLKHLQSYSTSLLPVRVWCDGKSDVVDSISGQGIEEFRNNLFRFAHTLPWFRELLPRKWIELGHKLQHELHQRKVFLTWTAYTAIAAECGLDGDSLKSATLFMHESGNLRYFGYTYPRPEDTYRSSKSNSCVNFLLACCCSTTQKESHVGSIETAEEKSHSLFDDIDIDEALRDTIYISPSWICDIMKGLIRHERDSLIRFFALKNDHEMVLRVKRAVCSGILHESLIEFLWPAADAAAEYWHTLSQHCESEVWRDKIISQTDDLPRALAVLFAFDLIATRKSELVVPMLVRGDKIKTSGSMGSLLCPFSSQLSFCGLPGESIVLSSYTHIKLLTKLSLFIHFLSL